MNIQTPILEVRHLHKHYPKIKAVDGIDFSVPTGICFGLLGPNGAGKTTTIEMMEGIIRPSSGEILYKGEPMGPRFKNEVGIQFQSTALQDFLTVREHLNFFSRLYPKNMSVDELIEICSLQAYLDRDARKLSGGQRQRMLLAIALVNDPELCEQIAIMDHGKIIAQGSPNQLLAEHFQDVIIELPASDFPVAAQTLPHRRLEKVTPMIEISTRDVNATLAELLQAGASLAGLQVRPRSLEDLFLELTGKGLRP